MTRLHAHAFLALPFLAASCKPRTFHDNAEALETTAAPKGSYQCDILVAGGTTAALSTAIFAAKADKEVCLIEPTDWPGGQLTAEGLSAIDFSHQMGIKEKAFTAAKNEPIFWKWMTGIQESGRCWVSDVCYESKVLLDRYLKPELAKYPKLHVILNTVIKKVERNGKNITKVVAVNRRPTKGTGYENFLSDDLADWYSTTSSSKFQKTTVTFEPTPGANWVVVDATPFGDVLALSGASFLQGAEATDGGTTYNPGGDTCGQATVFPFVMEYTSQASGEAANSLPVPYPTSYSLKAYSGLFNWHDVWNYRRLKKVGGTSGRFASGGRAGAGDLSMQNWNPGNDYPFGYLLKSIAETKAETSDWKGGINLKVLKDVEHHAIGWHYWMKEKNPDGNGSKLKLNKNTYDANGALRSEGIFGTGTGLSKLPYLRDTRRSIGIDNFLITRKNLGYIDGKTGAVLTPAEKFPDTVAIGSYAFDIHPLKKKNEGGCDLPGYVYAENVGSTAAFYIPFRALTNRDIDNLLVAGRTMAQSFAANAAIRLQPIEWHSGVAAGISAAHMHKWKLSSRSAYGSISDLKIAIKAVNSPLEW